jgi:hypothetical protein
VHESSVPRLCNQLYGVRTVKTNFAQAVKAIMAQDKIGESDAKMRAWLIGPIEAQVYIDDFNAMQNKGSAQ